MAHDPLAGTLKVEIVKPESDSWDLVGARLRAMRWSLGPALNRTMRDLYVEAVDVLAAFRRKDEKRNELKYSLFAKVERTLRRNWNQEITATKEREDAYQKAHASRPVSDESFAPIVEYWSAETRHNIESRFAGEHLKDLLANRASFPSWHGSAAFYARGSKCAVEGPPSSAVLTLPLWGAGKKATRVVVAPCGGNGEAMWRKLVGGKVKLGRVGVAYDANRRKWFALISWSGESVAESVGKGIAVAHIGVSRFVQLATPDGEFHSLSGEDILVTRQRLAHRRRSIQACLKTMGSGSKGHGVKRRMRPITKLEDAESRFVTTRIRQVAHDVVGWCLQHNVGQLYWPDMTGAREGFEHKTDGLAHEEIKRLIHQFPFFELHKAVERDGKERGVSVSLHSVAYDSQTCPDCGHVDEANLCDVPQRVETIDYHGRRFTRTEVVKRFKCTACGNRGHRDVIACANALIRLGHKEAITKLRVKLRAETKAKTDLVDKRRLIAQPKGEVVSSPTRADLVRAG